MGFLDELLSAGSSPQKTAFESTPDSMKSFFGPILQAVAEDAKRKSDPINRLYDIGGAIFDSASTGAPLQDGLRKADAQRTTSIQGAAQLFLTMMGQERQLEQLKSEQGYRKESLDISRARLALEAASASRRSEEGTVQKLGETPEGVPIYGFVTKSGRVNPLTPGSSPTSSRSAAPPQSAVPSQDAQAAEVLALLEQAKRGPRYKWQGDVKGGETQPITPPLPFTAEPTQATTEEKPPYRIYKGKPVLTPAQQAADRAFGKTYEDFVASGGYADAEKNLTQLKSVHDRLQKGEKLTGPVFGSLPRTISRVSHPTETQALEMVEEVVQRNLRLVLGAQFTEKEGLRLISRAYNPALRPEQNAERLERLMQAMQGALDAKRAAAAYFEKHGTLAGYKGPATPSVTQLESAIDRPSGPKTPRGIPEGSVKIGKKSRAGREIWRDPKGDHWEE